MATTITLTWPSFNVDVSIAYTYFKANLSSNFDGLVGQPADLLVIFKTDYADADNTIVQNYWSSATAATFQMPVNQQVTNAIGAAMEFGTQMLVQFATQNVMTGITQSGKTEAVMDYCHELAHCLITGSLYAAINAINVMIADTSSTKTNLSPFITNNVLYTFLNKIQTYLGLPLTANPGS
jgi:hypothetical protein